MKFKPLLLILFLFSLFSCKDKELKIDKEKTSDNIEKTEKKAPKLQINESELTLNLTQANRLSKLPLHCLQNQYPNKLSQVLSDSVDLGTPKELHPAFYGCFDWASSVQGHWALVRLLKDFPDLESADSIRKIVKQNISKNNIQKEINYFKREQEYSFERMYGWSWLLKLQSELDSWDDKDGKVMSANLRPLSDYIVDKYMDFLPKLNYPLRTGMRDNSAFGMSFTYDYAKQTNNDGLTKLIEDTARKLYLKDKNAPIEWEPDGFDLFSPTLEEINLMQKILPRDEFIFWVDDFLPQLRSTKFDMKPIEITNQTDEYLAHLDGLNFSRACVFYRLAKEMPNEYGHLKALGDIHLAKSLSKITDRNYEGRYWLASFSLYALLER